MDLAKLENLEEKINQVLGVIANLRNEKNEVYAKNEALESQVHGLGEENHSLKERIGQLEADFNTVVAEKDQLASTNAGLEANRPGEAEAQKVDELMRKLESLDI